MGFGTKKDLRDSSILRSRKASENLVLFTKNKLMWYQINFAEFSGLLSAHKKVCHQGAKMALICQTRLTTWETHKSQVHVHLGQAEPYLISFTSHLQPSPRPPRKVYLYAILMHFIYLVVSHENSRLLLLTLKVVLKRGNCKNDCYRVVFLFSISLMGGILSPKR